MSYDVSIGDVSLNYTYNLAKFFIEFNVHPTTEMHGLNGEQVADAIERALRRIVRHPVNTLNAYNPDNGWGDWASATKWLMEIRDAGRKYPYERVEVS